jgi:hypothetical protein
MRCMVSKYCIWIRKMIENKPGISKDWLVLCSVMERKSFDCMARRGNESRVDCLCLDVMRTEVSDFDFRLCIFFSTIFLDSNSCWFIGFCVASACCFFPIINFE